MYFFGVYNVFVELGGWQMAIAHLAARLAFNLLNIHAKELHYL